MYLHDRLAPDFETEVVAGAAIEAARAVMDGGGGVVLTADLCTGSGCIAIAMAHHNPDWHVDGVDLSDEALSLAAENERRLEVRNTRFLKSDLFDGLQGEHYDLIVTNPPYVTNDETDALPQEYSYEPEMGLRAGDDGLDLVLRILRDAPLHLSEHGLLICEVGDSERAVNALLPELPLAWVEFKVGQMGVFVVERRDLVTHHARIAALAAEREAVATAPVAARRRVSSLVMWVRWISVQRRSGAQCSSSHSTGRRPWTARAETWPSARSSND